jgi:SAM-dependent methyltransferase
VSAASSPGPAGRPERAGAGATVAEVATEAAWHDVECGSYRADLELWHALARERGGPLLDVGCGTGRVALELAAAGHAVTGIDADRSLTAALAERAAAAGLPVRAVTADARSLTAIPAAAAGTDRAGSGGFPLALLPMQVAQLLGGPAGRAAMLRSVASQLAPGGLLALALADPFEAVEPGEARPPLPDVLEVDGWMLSSTPVAVRDEADAVAIDRIRQAVSPTGELTEQLASVTLDNCAPATLEDEGRAAGYAVLPARHVPPTPDYVGSTVVMLEAPR